METTYRIEHGNRVVFIRAYTKSQMRRDCHEIYGFWPDDDRVSISESSL